MLKRLIDYALFHLTARLPARLIFVRGAPYLERYNLFSVGGWEVNLHRFVSQDEEEHLHNHPWRFGLSLVLAGGYLEERFKDFTAIDDPHGRVIHLVKIRSIRRASLVGGHVFHRIARVEPRTWTLFVHSGRAVNSHGQHKRWGFLQAGTFVPVPDRPSNRWYLTAPKGKDVGREPYRKEKAR